MDGAKSCGAAAATLIRHPAPARGRLERAAPDPWGQWRLARGELVALDDEQLGDFGLSQAKLKCPVPIRSIGSIERQRIVEHLLALDAADRYWRFAYAASDEHIRRYVERIDFERDRVFGIFDRKREMIAMAHLARIGVEECESCVEFGVSVAKSMRGRGLGSRLLEHAIRHARNRGVQKMLMRILSENRPSLAIARRAGATVRARGAESEAWLTLSAATADRRLNEWFAKAAVAETHGCIVVTDNEKDFADVEVINPVRGVVP